MTSPEIRALAARIAVLEGAMGKRGSQLAFSSLEDGAIREFDLDGQQVAQYGTQFDGTHMAASLVGPKPPTPAAPQIYDAALGGRVRVTGNFAGGEVCPMDFSRWEIHVSSVDGFTPNAINPGDGGFPTLRATIDSPRGGEVSLHLGYDTFFYVKIIAVSLSGQTSDPSDQRTMYARPLSIDEIEEGLGAAIFTGPVAPAAPRGGDIWYDESGGAGFYTVKRWQDGVNGWDWYDLEDSGIAGAIAQAADAAADAAAAETLANNALTAAGSKITAFRQSSAPSTSGRTMGDIWIDSDDGLVYMWTGAWTLSADQRIGSLVTTVSTKTSVFAQTSQPATTGRTTGDMWLDTDDGNKVYVWDGSAWTVRRFDAAAIIATARQLGGVTVYRQTTAPTTGMIDGDLWIDSDDFNRVYLRVSGAWVLSDDSRIATVVASNATKTTLFAQTSQPSTSGRTDGDTWIDTDDGNKVYTWTSGAWTVRAWGPSAILATARELGSITVYRQSTAPATGVLNGDIWFDTSDSNKVYVRVAGAWTVSDDARIGTVVTSVAGKSTLFYQPSQPSTSGRSVGDTWIDSDDNLVYSWGGTLWNLTQIASTDLIASRATNLVTNGTGALGNNRNFSLFTFDGSDAPVGAAGAFLTPLGNAGTRFADELMPVDPTKRMRLSVSIRNKGTTTTGGYVYTGLQPFDAAKLAIDPSMYMYIPNTTTTLAVPLNPGDATVTLANAANWYGSAGKPAGNNSYWRRIIFWDYVDSFGKAWAQHTYSRNLLTGVANLTPTGGAWPDGGLSGNVITLNAPYAGPAKPAGTVVSNATSGGSYMYAGAVNHTVRPADGWVSFAQTFVAALVDGSVTSAGASSGWPQGIAYAKFMCLSNRLSSGAADAASQHSYALVSFGDAGAAAADAANAQATADLKTTVFRQASPPPTTGRTTGDMWIDTTDNNKVYVWTGAWTLSADQRIATVVASDAIKVSAFTQASAPSSSNRVTGDIWIDTDDGNKINVWSGSSWQPFIFGGTALAADAIDGKTITGALIRSASGGARWELSTGPTSNNLYGYTSDGASQPGRIQIDSTEGTISLDSPDYSVAGDGSGSASLIVGGNKAGAFSTVSAYAGDVTLAADNSVYLSASQSGARQSSLTISDDDAVPGNRRIIADSAGHAELLGLTARMTQKTAAGGTESKIDMYGGLIDLVALAAMGVRVNGRRLPKFSFGTFTGNSTSGGANTIPHTLGVIPTFVVCVNQNSGRYTAPDIANCTAANLLVYTRVLTTSGAPVSASASQTIMWFAMHPDG